VKFDFLIVMLMKTRISRVMALCQLLNFTGVLANFAASLIIVQAVQELRALTTLMTT